MLALRTFEHDVVGKNDVVVVERLGGLREVADPRRLHVRELKTKFQFHIQIPHRTSTFAF